MSYFPFGQISVFILKDLHNIYSFKVTSSWILWMTIMIIVAYCSVFNNTYTCIVVKLHYIATCDTYGYIMG